MTRFTLIASVALATAVLALPGSASAAATAQGSAKNAVIRWSSTQSAACIQVPVAAIEGFYCHEPGSFSFETDMASNGARHYASPLEAAREAGRSRIFQGIHFQFSNEDGRRAGRGIGSEIVSTKLLPVGAGARARSCRH